MNYPIRFVIPVSPVTKKNHSQIVKNKKGTFFIPSKAYREYLEMAAWYIEPLELDEPVNICAKFYMPTKRKKIDLTNLNAGLHDALVDCRLLKDDGCLIVSGTDGSRVYYDKDNPRTEVIITPMRDYNPFD